jgi:hypothetical protein
MATGTPGLVLRVCRRFQAPAEPATPYPPARRTSWVRKLVTVLVLTAIPIALWQIFIVRIIAIGLLAPLGDPAVPILAHGLRDGHRDVRVAAVQALQKLGPKARRATAALVQALADPDDSIPWKAADALGQLGPEAVADLVGALRSGPDGARGWAAQALATRWARRVTTPSRSCARPWRTPARWFVSVRPGPMSRWVGRRSTPCRSSPRNSRIAMLRSG